MAVQKASWTLCSTVFLAHSIQAAISLRIPPNATQKHGSQASSQYTLVGKGYCIPHNLHIWLNQADNSPATCYQGCLDHAATWNGYGTVEQRTCVGFDTRPGNHANQQCVGYYNNPITSSSESTDYDCYEVIAGAPAPAPATTTTTPTPTPPATPAPASATGDPHLQNIHGQRFDLMQPGVHVLVQIPRHAAIDETLFTVEAAASRLGGNCEELYFQTVNVTGAWADEAQAGMVRFDANSGGEEKPMWATFGPVALKVAHGRTEQGTKYLNVYVKHLERAGFAVGGLLGEDDHDEVSTPPAACKKRASLEKVRSHLSSRGSSAALTAEGTLA